MYVLETKVIDTGVGISDEIKKTLFVPFRELRTKGNLDAVTNKTIGLGLSFSKQICHQLNGNISLTVNKKKLSVFSVRLPVKYREPMRHYSFRSILSKA